MRYALQLRHLNSKIQSGYVTRKSRISQESLKGVPIYDHDEKKVFSTSMSQAKLFVVFIPCLSGSCLVHWPFLLNIFSQCEGYWWIAVVDTDQKANTSLSFALIGVLCISVVLLQNGEVYTFGSNQYGQLGQGDTAVK